LMVAPELTQKGGTPGVHGAKSVLWWTIGTTGVWN